MGDRLVVGVTRDSRVGKGRRRPVIPQAERLELIAALGFVDQVALVDDGIEALEMFHPDIFCKGHDYVIKGLLDAEIRYCKEHHIKIAFTTYQPQTTSAIIERIRHG